VKRQIHQNVDPILPNQIRSLRIRQTHDAAPDIRVTPELIGQRVRLEKLGVTKYLHFPMIVLAQQRQ